MKKILIVLMAFSILLLTACGDKDVVSTENNTPIQTNTTTIVTDNQQPVQQNNSGVIYNDIFNEDGNLISVCNLFKFLQDAEPSFKLTEKADSTLAKEEKLFLKNDNSKLESMTDYSIDNRMLTKNIDKYGDKLIFVEDAFVIAINEEVIENLTISAIQVNNTNGDIYYIYSLNAHDDVFDGDIINIHGLPVGKTSYENVSGGSTHAVVLASAYIEKVEQ